MAYVINPEKCISCGNCADTCPASCITAGANTYVIDAEACLACGACADVCPQSAISEE